MLRFLSRKPVVTTGVEARAVDLESGRRASGRSSAVAEGEGGHTNEQQDAITSNNNNSSSSSSSNNNNNNDINYTPKNNSENGPPTIAGPSPPRIESGTSLSTEWTVSPNNSQGPSPSAPAPALAAAASAGSGRPPRHPLSAAAVEARRKQHHMSVGKLQPHFPQEEAARRHQLRKHHSQGPPPERVLAAPMAGGLTRAEREQQQRHVQQMHPQQYMLHQARQGPSQQRSTKMAQMQRERALQIMAVERDVRIDHRRRLWKRRDRICMVLWVILVVVVGAVAISHYAT